MVEVAAKPLRNFTLCTLHFTFVFAAALSGAAKTFDIDISTGRPSAANGAYYHGETIEFRAVRGRTAVTNIEYSCVYYQTNGMGEAWWKTDGLVFHPTNDVGASSYRFFLEGREIVGSGGVESGGVDSPTPSLTHSPTTSRDWHANGLLRLLDSPGFIPNALPLPVHVLDFSHIDVVNAPWTNPDYSTSNAALVATIEATAPAPGNYAAVSNAAMSALPNDATLAGIANFSNAVLAVGLNIDTNAVAAINALVKAGDELPIGGAATVGGLLLALAAAVAALKRGKADASALAGKQDRYAFVTPAVSDGTVALADNAETVVDAQLVNARGGSWAWADFEYEPLVLPGAAPTPYWDEEDMRWTLGDTDLRSLATAIGAPVSVPGLGPSQGVYVYLSCWEGSEDPDATELTFEIYSYAILEDVAITVTAIDEEEGTATVALLGEEYEGEYYWEDWGDGDGVGYVYFSFYGFFLSLDMSPEDVAGVKGGTPCVFHHAEGDADVITGCIASKSGMTQDVDTIIIPAPRQDGRVRDFGLYLELENVDGALPSIRFVLGDQGAHDWVATEGGSFPTLGEGLNVINFTEIRPNLLLVKHEIVKETVDLGAQDEYEGDED